MDGWLVGLAALVPTVAAATALVMQALHKVRQERRDAVIAEWQKIADEKDKEKERSVEQLTGHIARLDAVIDSLQGTILDLRDKSGKCETLVSSLYGWVERYRDTAVYLRGVAIASGRDGGPEIPAMPDRPDRQEQCESADFQARQAAQTVKLAKHIGQQVIAETHHPEGGNS
jgi:hypothetical protein